MEKMIIVLGYGKSTKTAIDVLREQYNAKIYVYDETPSEELRSSEFYLESFDKVPMNQVLFCLKSPGIAYSKEYVKIMNENKIPIYTDVELFLTKAPGKIIGITGTNGKTTVTTLIGDVLKQQFDDVRVCGNIGIPIADVCRNATDATIFVVELSSFQLKGTRHFKPDIGIILNFSDAHLDFHKTEEDYRQSKARMFAKQDENDILIYNQDDENVMEYVKQAKSTQIGVGKNKISDVQLRDDEIVFGNNIFPLDIVKVPGEHNCFNIGVAFAVGVLCGVETSRIQMAIQSFAGVKHRLQYVKTVNSIDVYNDSKSTNESAVKTALKAFDVPIIWICGGYDRGIAYTNIQKSDLKNVKHMIVYGMMTPIFSEIASNNNVPYTVVDNFSEIFSTAMSFAGNKEVVLFSPGAASYDLFANFEQRGEMFLQLVEQYK
ncbi:MAG: UDP-N-acetylmuramoyl-L-alanine--D-glutamate ligase [Culicoidibacterales bacterium]